ncbi:MAG: hypothetical protein SOI56_01810 [Eubacteriales bacterium]|jgi:hypothetical protein
MYHYVDKEKGIDMWMVDDSKMPSPEEVKKFPDTSALDKEFEKKLDEIDKEFGLL